MDFERSVFGSPCTIFLKKQIMDFTEPWIDSCSHVGHTARAGDLENMKLFIQRKMPVDVADNRGWRPLHEAAAVSPNLACLEELLKHGKTNVNWTTHEGETALLLACKRRRDSTADMAVQLLLQHGADANLVDNEEESPLLAAARNGNTDVVKRLVNSEAVNVNSADCSGWYPLHEAAFKGDTEMLISLLRAGARLNVQDECGMTPIFTAAQYGREGCLQELLRVAIEREQNDVVNIGAEDWATPLMIAAQQGFVNCIKILLEYGANPDLQTSDNAMALHMAVQGDQYKCLEVLLSKTNLEPLKTAYNPPTAKLCNFDIICPLHLAVEWKSHVCLEKLLDAGFSPDSLYDCSSIPFSAALPFSLPQCETALSYAVHKRNVIAMNILLRAGANCNPPMKDAFHPLMRAVCNSTLQEVNFLIENGSDVNYQRPDLPTNELLLVSFFTNISIIKLLLCSGCDPNLCFPDGNPISLSLFLRCVTRYVHTHWPSVGDFLRLLLSFIIVTRPVQIAFRSLCAKAKECSHHEFSEVMWNDVLSEVDKPSPLKKICFVKIRQHMYSIHGVNFIKFVHSLNLPPSLVEYLTCSYLRTF